jgi:lipopolysaccharide transport system ATP-binding protein
MKVRLAFAVAAHLEPEILLVDEVLAVGDIAFQKKCLGKMGQVAQEGRTVLFVSHSMGSIQALCRRVIQLHDGMIKRDGPAAEVIAQYTSDTLALAQIDLSKRRDRSGSGLLRVTGLRFENGCGRVIDRVQSGQELRIILSYHATGLANRVSFEISFYTPSAPGIAIFHCSTEYLGLELHHLTGQGEIACLIPKLLLPASDYYLDVATIELGLGYADYVEAAATLPVLEGDFFGYGQVQAANSAVAVLEHTWSVDNSLNGHGT